MGTLKNVGIVVGVFVLVLGLGIGYLALTFQPPDASVEDEGEWGEVNNSSTEVVTTLQVQNNNDYAISVGDSVGAEYHLYFNDVRVASGEKRGVSLPQGESEIELRTYIENEQLVPWWAEFVRADETIVMDTTVTADASFLGQSFQRNFSLDQRRMMEDDTPIINSFSGAANQSAGRYTADAGVEEVGYVVERGHAEWAEVEDNQTTVLFKFDITNPSDNVPIPAEPDGLRAEIGMNGVNLMEASGDEFEMRSSTEAIQPGETRTVVYAVEMDNQKIDEWFRSHVRNDEVSDVEVTFQMQFSVQGQTFSVPRGAGATYECQLQTGMLIDDQETDSTCGDEDSAAP
jgi:LEA14-like dessication related protein